MYYKEVMRAGYERDRDASAKALKAAIKNSKKDKVLYGAVIKAESVFSSMTTTAPPTPPTPTLTTTAQTPPPPPPAAPSVSPTVSGAPSSAPSMAPSTISSLSMPVHPLAAMLTSGMAGLRPTGTRSAPTSSTSPMVAPKGVFDLATIQSALSKLKKVEQTIKPPEPPSSLEKMAAESMVVKSKLKHVDPRESNVSLRSAADEISPRALQEQYDMANEDINRAYRATIPTLRQLATKAVGAPTEMERLYTDRIKAESAAAADRAGEESFVSAERARIKAESAAVAKRIEEEKRRLAELVSQERQFATLKPKPTSTNAPTVASTLPDDGPSPPSSPTSDEPMPALQVDLYDMDTDEGKAAQTMAKELLTLTHQKQAKAGVREKKQETITSYRLDGTKSSQRLIVKFNNNRYQFDRKIGKTTKSMRWYPDSDNTGISVIRSLTQALEAVKQERYNANPKKGETSGLGLSSDPEKIHSQRVVYTSRKNGNLVKKGQLYLMEPQLLKGHIRLYNKSGRPVVSRSNVSPSFQRLAKDIVERNTFEADDYSSLDPKETADANKFIEATKPIQPRNIDRLSNADTVWQLKKRYEVLVGELSAGNSGKLVRDEMESGVRSLIRLHAMNVDKGRELIRSLREF